MNTLGGDIVGFLDGLKGLFGGGGDKKKSLPRADVDKRFDLQGKTGQGSMSKVFKAYDKKLGRMVCLKVMDKAKTEQFENRFKAQGLKKPSEGEICMSLRHDNLVMTYEHGLTTKGEPYLVMEWIEGYGLNYLIETKNKQLDGNRVDYFSQLCQALEYLHGQKYLHRDLCARNVMVNGEGKVKLIDLGLTIPYTPEFCRPGNRTGTADILAPELIKRSSTDHRIDIFALGVTGFEIFTGQLPWERAMSTEETLRKHLNTPPRRPKDLNPKLEDDICAILERCIAREPSARFSSASGVRQALENLEKTDY